MATEYQRVRDYELMVIFHPELSEEDLAAEIATVEGWIVAQEGTLRLTNRETPWGRRRLAYPIRHGGRDLRDGVYVLLYFTSVSTVLAEIERDIKLDDKIIRYLLTQQGAPMMEPVVEEEAAEGDAAPDAEGDSEKPAASAAETVTEAAPVAEAPAEEAAPVAEAAAEETASTDESAAEETASTAEAAAEEAAVEETAPVAEAADEPAAEDAATEDKTDA